MLGPTVPKRMMHPDVLTEWEALVSRHLELAPRSVAEDGWKYRQRLVAVFPFLASFWTERSDMVRVSVEAAPQLTSAAALGENSELRVLSANSAHLSSTAAIRRRRRSQADPEDQEKEVLQQCSSRIPTILLSDVARLSETHRSLLFADRAPSSMEAVGDCWLISWVKNAGVADARPWRVFSGRVHLLPVEAVDPEVFGVRLYWSSDFVYPDFVLNVRNPVVEWIAQAWDEASTEGLTLVQDSLEALLRLLDTPLHHGGHEIAKVERYLTGWDAEEQLAVKPPRFVWDTNDQDWLTAAILS
jgi:hypothetical protein